VRHGCRRESMVQSQRTLIKCHVRTIKVEKTRIVCVQVRTRLIRDGLDAILRGLPTVCF